MEEGGIVTQALALRCICRGRLGMILNITGGRRDPVRYRGCAVEIVSHGNVPCLSTWQGQAAFPRISCFLGL